MNTRKLLSMLMVSLGAFSLVLTGCNNKKDSSSPSTEPSVSTSSSTTPSEDTSSVSNPSVSVDSSTDVSTDSSLTDSSSDVEVIPEATTYDVTFNYDEPKDALTVWTDFAIDQTIAPYNENKAHLDDAVDRRTVPLTQNPDSSTVEGQAGMYYFAVDADGYLVYASYGTGAGYGSPCDDYYHNQPNGKDYFKAPYWSLHEEYAPWSTNPKKVVIDGVTYDDYQLFDFVIPEGGFVVKGHYKEATMKDFWKQLTGQNNVPLGALASVGGENNATLVGKVGTDDLEKLYFSITETEDGTRKLSVRERTTSEKIDDEGDQLTDTPAVMFTATDADNPLVYTTVEDVAALADDSLVENVKGVISFKSGSNVIIVDENGDSILLYSSDLADYVVGDTIAISGTKTTYNGDIEIKSITSHTKLAKYGKLTPVDAIEMTEENVDEVWVADNNYKTILIKHAQVVSIVDGGTSKLMLGETEIALYKATFPETISEGDYVDVLVAMMNYNTTIQGQVMSENDFARYYSITVDVDGEEGILEPEIFGKADGETFEVSAENADSNYEFSHWEKYDAETDTWIIISTDADLVITVEAADAQYRAVFVYSAWSKLPETMGQNAEITVKETTVKKSELTVITDPEVGVRGTWLSPYDVQWNTIIAVDADGKIAYLTYNPANGFGGPSGAGYYTHPEYAAGDYHDNPAFVFLDGYGPWVAGGDAHTKFEVHAPEGGFLITTHDDPNGVASSIVRALTNGAVEQMSDANRTLVNSRDLPIDPATRMFYDKAAGKLRIFVPSVLDGHYLVKLNELGATASTGIGVFLDDESNTLVSSKVEGRYTIPALNKLGESQYVMAVDANGKIIYASYGLQNGYGSPCDDYYASSHVDLPKSSKANRGTLVGDLFAIGEKYANWDEYVADGKNVTISDNGDYELLIPTGGFVVTGPSSNKNMKYLVGHILGRNNQNMTTTLNNVADATLDDVKVELVYNNGVPHISVTNESTAYVNPNNPSVATLEDMEGFELAVYGEMYSDLTVADDNTHISFTGTAPKTAWIYDNNEIVYATTITSTEDGYTISVPTFNFSGAYSIAQTWTVESTNYKAVGYHSEEGVYIPVTGDEENVGTFTVGLTASSVSVRWDSIAQAFTGTFSCGAWGSMNFTYTDAEGNATLLTYDNTNFAGIIQPKRDVFGAYMGYQIFIEEAFAVGEFMNRGDTQSFKFTYVPAASADEKGTLTVN